MGRLRSLVRRMKDTLELLNKYNETFQDQLNKGIIEKVDTSVRNSQETTKKHYVPHHVVITPSKAMTKICIVYDGSEKTKKEAKSLNECLLRGPVILEDLCGLLLHFRLERIALLADFEKAFLQVGLQPSEQGVTRFRWLKDISKLDLNGNLQIYHFARVPFGVISSPFLLGATDAHHLKKKENPIAEKIRKNIYVDNVITRTRIVVEAYDLYVEARNIFQAASMNLREWMSNSTEFLSLIPDNDRAHGENIKVLGIHWNPKEDNLRIKAPNIEMLNAVDTKRKLLQTVATIFDPLGYFSTVILAAKLLLHKLWINGINWDLPLNTQYLDELKAIATELERISTIAIPRFIGIAEITPDTNYYLLCFCDVSKFAFSTTIYLRISNHECQVNLLFAKCCLPPKKETTLPRLELLGTLIGVQCLNFMQKELRLPIHKRILWTNSQCVLHWLVSKKLLNAFVENRLKEIRAQSNLNYR